LEIQPGEGTISLLEEGAFMKPSFFDLRGKVVIVSGGATGIGRAIADGLAEAGASLVICGRRFHKCEEACKEIEERTGTRALAHRCDITSKDEIETLVNTVLDECKKVDILVNSAGVTSDYHVLDLSEEDQYQSQGILSLQPGGWPDYGRIRRGRHH
jgi:NAD(P)-dependent dehydrogenase (short-subunit alcohol dehydrogenase family)